MNRESPDCETIVLIHGIAAKRLVMWPLSVRLTKADFNVHIYRYSSLFSSIESHAARLSDFLKMELGPLPCVHLVAHSMGAIIVRAALQRGSYSNLGRVVLLAPPNRGSPVARAAAPMLGSFIPPMRELSDRPTSYVRCIASDPSVDPSVPIGILAARYDVVVPERNTHLEGEREHRTLHATHNSLLFSSSVAAKIANFLRHGYFEYEPNSGAGNKSCPPQNT